MRRRVIDAASIGCHKPPPSSVLRAAASGLAVANQYPDPRLLEDLLRAAASYYGVATEMIVPVPGSDTALEIIARALKPRAVASPWPGFYAYAKIPHALGLPVYWVEARPGPGPAMDPSRALEAARQAGVMVVDNPVNPLGNPALDPDAVEAILDAGAVVVWDEAYAEYTGETLAPKTRSREGLIVLRTMSKAFALAGLRIGFIIAHPTLASAIKRADPLPYRISTPALKAAATALASPDYALQCAREQLESVEKLRRLLEEKGITAHPTIAPYILVETGNPRAHEEALKRGVKTTPLNWWRPGALRVAPTPGLEEEIAETIAEAARAGRQSA